MSLDDFTEPGSDRRKFFVTGNSGEIMAGLTKIIGRCGVASFEFGYIVDGDDQEREPEPGEEVTWYAEVTYPGGGEPERAIYRTSDHDRGPIQATVNLMTEIGANVAVLEAPPS